MTHYIVDTFDVYIANTKVWLIDFNVFGAPTNSLLFDWNELIQKNINSADKVDVELIEYRVVNSPTDVLSSEKGTHRGPIDVTLSSDFNDFMRICEQQQMEDTDEDD